MSVWRNIAAMIWVSKNQIHIWNNHIRTVVLCFLSRIHVINKRDKLYSSRIFATPWCNLINLNLSQLLFTLYRHCAIYWPYASHLINEAAQYLSQVTGELIMLPKYHVRSEENIISCWLKCIWVSNNKVSELSQLILLIDISVSPDNFYSTNSESWNWPTH